MPDWRGLHRRHGTLVLIASDTLRAAIRDYRAAGGTQKELCRAMGIHPVRLSSWLRHREAMPPADDQRVKRLAKLLDLDPATCVIDVANLT